MGVLFITTDKAVAAMLRSRGFEVAGTLDEQVPKDTFYVAYSDRQMRAVGQYVPRKLCWNVRVWNHRGVFSMSWYGTPESALRGVERLQALEREHRLK